MLRSKTGLSQLSHFITGARNTVSAKLNEEGLPGIGASCLRHLGWERLQERLEERLISAVSRAAPVLQLAQAIDEARARLWELDGLEWVLERDTSASEADAPLAHAVTNGLRDLEDLTATLSGLGRGAQLSIEELVAVRILLETTDALERLLRIEEPGEGAARGLGALRGRLDGLSPSPDLLARLERSIAFDDISGAPMLSDDASPELKGARKQRDERKRGLVRAAESLVKRSSYVEALQDSFWTERDGRVVLPFRSGGLGSVRQGIIHGSSGSGQTMFVEPPELVQDNNALRSAQLRVAAEERRILAELSREIAAQATQLTESQLAAAEFDRIRARLLLCRAVDGLTPQLTTPEESASLSLPGARHPLMLLDDVDVVPNDLRCEQGAALVVTGPNAGGKTVALKTVGIAVLMARAGLRVPTAEAGSIPFFRNVVTDVGDDQSIAANLSTFSAHVGHLRQAIADAEHDGPGTLVLLDEIAVGTDPEQGAALAEAVLLHLIGAGATVVVTTHYERLKLLASHDELGSRFHNAAVGFDVEQVRPTFEVSMGLPGSSSAITVARRLGLTESVLRHAESLLGDESLRVEVLLRELEAERSSLAAARAELERQVDEVSRKYRDVERREKRTLEGAKSRKQKAFESAASELRDLEAELKDKRKRLRRHGAEALPERGEYVGDAGERLGRHRESERLEGSALTEVVVGQRVLLPALGSEGTVEAIKGDRATVQLPTVKTTVKLEDLRPAAAASKAKPKRGSAEPIYSFKSRAGQHFGSDAKPVDPGIDGTIDLRGTRFDAAPGELEDALSVALERDREVVVIQHGHGSGELRRGIREHLSRLSYVERHRPGLPAEGGDAVTVVWIKP